MLVLDDVSAPRRAAQVSRRWSTIARAAAIALDGNSHGAHHAHSVGQGPSAKDGYRSSPSSIPARPTPRSLHRRALCRRQPDDPSRICHRGRSRSRPACLDVATTAALMPREVVLSSAGSATRRLAELATALAVGRARIASGRHGDLSPRATTALAGARPERAEPGRCTRGATLVGTLADAAGGDPDAPVATVGLAAARVSARSPPSASAAPPRWLVSDGNAVQCARGLLLAGRRARPPPAASRPPRSATPR